MRKFIFCIACLLSLTARAQLVERIFVSTDRNVYIAGDDVWCSLFSLDAGKGSLSDFSALAYLELISTDGTAATAKIALSGGRGGGKFRIPKQTPSGNYLLVAYTAQNTNEKGTGWMKGAKCISVFNTTSAARVKEGVQILDQASYNQLKEMPQAEEGGLSFHIAGSHKAGGHFTLVLNNSSEAASLSVSVFHEDGILAPETIGLGEFLSDVKASSAAVRFTGSRTPEYEGEIIYAAVEGLADGQLEEMSGQALATLSSAGSPSDVYVGKVGDKGKLVFFTNNIYGDRELVCEVDNRAGSNGYISLMDNFVHPTVSGVEKLRLSASQYGDLVHRKAAFASSLQADTLFSFLPRRQDYLLRGVNCQRYHLDDYTRFPSFHEVLTEVVKEVRIRKVYGRREVQLMIKDPLTRENSFQNNILTMLDGVVITDISLLEKLDAMLLEDVELYRQTIALGGISYNGAVNFVTRKNYVKALQFPSHVRVVDFRGVSYPVAYLGVTDFNSQEPDYRQLLYWHPLMDVKAGEIQRISLKAPAYTGVFRVVAEGMSESGKAIRKVFKFEIN